MTFSRSADLYDLLYAWKDYAAEAEQVRGLVEAQRPGARTLLDVACGTGMHLAQLRQWYEVAGVDFDSGLLEIARRRLPGVPLHLGDMREFDLGQRFDAVTCLFSSIGYMQARADLDLAVANMARHLGAGGVLIVEPWLDRAQFTEGHIGGPLTAESDGIKVVRMNDARVDGHHSVMEFHYLVGRDGRVEHFTERHSLSLFGAADYRAAFEAAGLRTEHDAEGLMGRGLWIGVRPA
jgi:SAM-dependent methyltransferase